MLVLEQTDFINTIKNWFYYCNSHNIRIFWSFLCSSCYRPCSLSIICCQ